MMKGKHRAFHSRGPWLAFSIMLIVALIGISLTSDRNVAANHPVLVEGNCDSPVPGTTIVTVNTCGDYDGDGRIGTAEDTDGADRIFGTINAALGPGTGAAAGTGANHNGTVTIVRSGRFAETIYIGQSLGPGTPGGTSPGHVTLEAAPGVDANIDAVFQGDPAGGNTARQAGVGIQVQYFNSGFRVVLRNLMIRNFQTGVLLTQNSRVTMESCRLENNRDYGIRLLDDARLAAFKTQITATGFRIPVSGPSNPGHAISFEGGSAGTIYHSLITGSFGSAISNTSSLGAGSVRYYELFRGPTGGAIVNATRDAAP